MHSAKCDNSNNNNNSTWKRRHSYQHDITMQHSHLIICTKRIIKVPPWSRHLFNNHTAIQSAYSSPLFPEAHGRGKYIKLPFYIAFLFLHSPWNLLARKARRIYCSGCASSTYCNAFLSPICSSTVSFFQPFSFTPRRRKGRACLPFPVAACVFYNWKFASNTCGPRSPSAGIKTSSVTVTRYTRRSIKRNRRRGWRSSLANSRGREKRYWFALATLSARSSFCSAHKIKRDYETFLPDKSNGLWFPFNCVYTLFAGEQSEKYGRAAQAGGD